LWRPIHGYEARGRHGRLRHIHFSFCCAGRQGPHRRR
jgi:hypothetical protein